MSKSEQKESPSSSSPPPQASETERDEFVAALKEDGDEGLKKAFQVLKKGRPTATALVKGVHLKGAVAARGGPEISDEKANQIIQQLNKQGLLSCEEFVDLVKWLEEPGEADQTKKIYDTLKEMEEQTMLTLYGEAGVGKTWTATQVANVAVRKGDFDAAIWVYLNRIYQDKMSLLTSIACQLSVLADFEEFVAELEAEKKAKAEEARKKEPGKEEKLPEKEDVAEKKRAEKIETLIVDKIKEKKILLILDSDGGGSRTKAKVETKKMDVGGDKKEDEGEKKKDDKNTKKEEEKEEKVVLLKLSSAGGPEIEIKLGVLKSYKVLTTETRNGVESGKNGVVVKPFNWDKSKRLAAPRVRDGVKEENWEEVEELAGYFMFKSKRLPSQLLLICRIVSYHGNKGESGLQKLRNDRDTIKKGEGEGEGAEKLLNVLIKGYEERIPKSILIDCYGPDTPENHFMRRGRAVSFNEVICYWIMEGHLGHFDRYDGAYHKGHRILMELMYCGLLQKQEGDCVTPSGATTFKFHINDYKEFFSCIRPGIGVTFDMSLGRVALADGMIRTTSSKSSSTSSGNNRDKQRTSTLLLDGKRIGEEEERPTESLSENKDLVEVLAISDPTSQHFKLPILEMKNLRLLALRGCQFLNNLERFLEKKPDQEVKERSPQNGSKSDEEKKKSAGIEGKSDGENKKSPEKAAPPPQISEQLKGLTVVEISGRNSQIKTIPDHLFTLIPNLKTLNLSHLLQVKSLPPSFYLLTKIEFLILRGCESLQELKSLKSFKDLKILDVSESNSFEKFEDKSLHTNTKLQILNLSKTKLKTLPLINQLKELKFVWLSDCHELPRIRKIDKMNNLQIFDISGAGEVERFCDPSLEDLKNLIIVDISRTKIRRLPANLGDPTYLYAKGCLKLKVVPPVEELKKLQVLDLSGCIHLKEVRKEFFANVNHLTELNLSETEVEDLPFLGDHVTLRRLILSGCEHLKKVEKLSCLKELEFLDLSGCKKVMELEEGSFDEMKNLEHLNLSGTGIGGQQKPLPSLSKLESLKQLHVRDCPNLTALPGVEEVPTLELVDYSGTILESPPCFSKDHPPLKPKRVLGAGIESIDTTQLFNNLGAKGDYQVQKWDFKQEDVRECKWIISNWRVEVAEKLGTPVYGAHFRRLLMEYPLFLTQNLSIFRFLVYPSEEGARVHEESYVDELSLREIYFEQVCEERMEKCLEIREFKELPESLHDLIAQAQLVVLVDDPFLKSLLDLRVDSTMPMKACWIESCSELQHVVAAPPVKVGEKTGEAAKSEGEKGKNAKKVELPEGGGDQRKKIGEKPNEAAAKGGKDQQKKAAEGKPGEPAKSESDHQQNAAAGNSGESEKSAEPAKGESDQQNNAAEEKPVDAAKSEGVQQTASAAEEKSEEPAKNEVNQPENIAADKSGESSRGEGDQQNNAAVEKPGDAAKSEGSQQTDTAADKKSEEPAKNEVNQPENVAADNSGESSKGKDDQQNNAAEGKPVDAAKREGDQQTATAVDAAKIGGDQPKNAEEDTSGAAAKSEGDQQNMTAADTAKVGGDEQKKDAEEKSGVAAKSESNQQKTAGADKKSGEPAKNEGDQAKNDAAGKTGDDHQKNNAEEKSGEEAKNPTEDLNKLETLWISDVSNLKSVCEGDIKTMSFNFLKSLYLEYCPQLSAICSSYLQLPSLKTLFIKYCPNMKSLFSEENPSKMKKLQHLQLWGLDKLQKINCKAPLLSEVRVGECPLLEHVIASRLITDADAEEVRHENEGHEHLETLHIKSCDNLKSIFEHDQDDQDVVFEKLTELELSGLPKLKKVARAALALKVLRVADCPSLRSVIDSPDGAHDLETVEVKCCEKMEAIIASGGSKLLGNMKNILLLGLPELVTVGAKLPRDTGYVKKMACHKLGDFEFDPVS